MFIELWDAANPNGGVYADGSIGELAGGLFVDSGNYYLEIDGEYLDYETEKYMMAPDGVYTVDIFAQNLENEEFGDWDGPFYIKSTNPNIEFDENEEQLESITGTIDDQFVDFKEPVEENIGVPYDVNEHLEATYGISNGDE